MRGGTVAPAHHGAISRVCPKSPEHRNHEHNSYKVLSVVICSNSLVFLHTDFTLPFMVPFSTCISKSVRLPLRFVLLLLPHAFG